MLELFENRKTNPEKEKVVRDIVRFFAHEVEITDGEIRVYESAEKEGLVFVSIKVGFMVDCCADLLCFSEIVKNVLYLSIEPNGDKISVRFGVEDVFVK